MTPAPATDLVVRPRTAGPRCPWGASTPDYVDYHDTEWGRPVHGDVAIFERLTLEAFQSGLCLAHDPAQARGLPRRLRRLRPRDRRGVRPRTTARACSPMPASCATGPRSTPRSPTPAPPLDLLDAEGEGALDRLVWSLRPGVAAGRARARPADVAASTPESVALAKALKRRGFVFVGPTTMYAAMQAMGLVDDHLAAATCRLPVASAARAVPAGSGTCRCGPVWAVCPGRSGILAAEEIARPPEVARRAKRGAAWPP